MSRIQISTSLREQMIQYKMKLWTLQSTETQDNRKIFPHGSPFTKHTNEQNRCEIPDLDKEFHALQAS